VILFRRNNFASASFVSLFPRPRIRDITWERFRFEKTSAILQPSLPAAALAKVGAFNPTCRRVETLPRILEAVLPKSEAYGIACMPPVCALF
jgi:hypothetical protein